MQTFKSDCPDVFVGLSYGVFNFLYIWILKKRLFFAIPNTIWVFNKHKLLLFFVLLSSFSMFSQKIDLRSNDVDIRQILLSIFTDNDSIKKEEDHGKIAFSLVPAPDMKSAEGGLVVSFVTTFFMDENHDTTKMSEVYFTPTTSFTGQYSFPIQS